MSLLEPSEPHDFRHSTYIHHLTTDPNCRTLSDLHSWYKEQFFNSRMYEFSGNTLELEHDFLLSDIWYTYDACAQSDVLTLTNLVTESASCSSQSPIIKATIEQDESSLGRLHLVNEQAENLTSLDQIVSVLQQYHPFEVAECEPEWVLYKCGDISSLFREVIRYKFGIEMPIVSGGIYDPETGEGWNHAYNVIRSDVLDGLTNDVYIDGTALQFCDDIEWPQSLGPQERIDTVHVIPEDHPHREYYAPNRDVFFFDEYEG